MISLIKLTENDKKFLVIILLGLILLFVIVGYVALLIRRIMKIQGSKADHMLKNVVEAEYFDTEGKLIKFGIKKNIRYFYRESRIPFIIMAATSALLLVFCIITARWNYNPFNNVDGFGTLLFEFSEWPKEKFFGIKLISGFPTVTKKPEFVPGAWVSYLFVPGLFVGGIWYLICTQAYIARSIRIYQIARSIYRKKLTPPTESTN